jgi:outer membrane protein OmpA-like peptidoglycan-associated protein
MALTKTTKKVLIASLIVVAIGFGAYIYMRRTKSRKEDYSIEVLEDVFDNLNFEFEKADIKKDSYPYLDNLADTLKKAKNWTIEIQGHTDDKGSSDYNMKLSQNRADAVKNYLITKGVMLDTITAKGFGESKPLVPNDSDSNREKNRRVEFKITKPNNQVITTIV